MVKRKLFQDLTNRQKRNRVNEQRHALNRITNIGGALQVNEAASVLCNNESLDAAVEQGCNEDVCSLPTLINENAIIHKIDDHRQESDFGDNISSGEESADSRDHAEIFTTNLAITFKNANVTLRQGNLILATLRTHPCLNQLPKDIRTLLGTCKFTAHVKKIAPGEYWHLGVSNALTSELSRDRYTPELLQIDISTDGASADNRGLIQYWPLQIKIVNLSNSRPLIIGVYRGKGNPADVNEFFQDFVDEMRQLLIDGIVFRGKCIPIKIRGFIADAPARAFVLRHRGHVSMHPCSKCKVVGTRYEENHRRKVRTGTAFYGTEHEPRTDEEAVIRFDTDHYLEGQSPLTQLNVGLVSSVPFEYMHPVLGIMKKLCEAWFDGKYSRRAKLSAQSINIVSVRLQDMASSCPSEFQGRPRAISQFNNYKATEFRHLLLYAGPVVLEGVLEEDYYAHFLLLHSSMRILASPNPSQFLLEVADQSLKLFVDSADELYGPSFLSYNVHCLVHMTEDVRKFGPLDSYSAFPYENNMPMFKKFVRHHYCPLQQFAMRLMERNYLYPSKTRIASDNIIVSKKHSDGPLPPNNAAQWIQYKQLCINKTRYSIYKKDNSCKLRDKSLCKISNILQDDNGYYFVVKKYVNPESFYDVGFSSNEVDIFKCGDISNELQIIPFYEVASKCYVIKLWSSQPEDLLRYVPQKYVVMVLLHHGGN